MTKTEQQIVALAGLFQAMEAVDQIARTGDCDTGVIETALSSLLVSNPDTALAVFERLHKIKRGLENINLLLNKNTPGKQLNWVRYALAVIHLEAKLRKQPSMLDTIGSRIERLDNQIQHFGLMHENVFESAASIYLDTISTFKLRVQVSGDPNYLNMALNTAKIRTLLLAGIRAATLWRQVGGHRWHFIFYRARLTSATESLLRQLRPH